MGFSRWSNFILLHHWETDWMNSIVIIKVHKVFECINMRLILDVEHSLPLKLHLFLNALKSVIWKTLIKQLLLICQLLILRRKHVVVDIVILLTKTYFLHGNRALNVKGSHVSLTLQCSFKREVFDDFSTWFIQIA